MVCTALNLQAKDLLFMLMLNIVLERYTIRLFISWHVFKERLDPVLS